MTEIIFKIICAFYGLYSLYVIAKPYKMPYYLGITLILDAITQAYGTYSIVLSLGGISLYISDMPVIVMIVILILTKAKITKSWISGLWFIMFITVMYSAFMGWACYGVNNYYLSDVRAFLTLCIPILYFYIRPIQLSHNIIKYFSNIIFGLVGYCYFVWVVYLFTGINLCSSINAIASGGLRVWSSTIAFVIAVWTLFMIYTEIVICHKDSISVKTMLMIISVVILQHNSVWAAMIVGIVSLIILHYVTNEKSIYGKINQKNLILQLILILFLGIGLLIAFSDSYLIQSILSTGDKYNQIGSGTGTIGDRQTIWALYLTSLSKAQWIIGKPMGTGWFVMRNGISILSPPHNAYVQGIMRIGISGTVSLYIMLIIVLITSIKKKRPLGAAILLASFTYLYADMYSLEMSCIWGILTGILMNSIDEGYFEYKLENEF